MSMDLEESELLRRVGRLADRDSRPRDWANLTELPHERMAFVYPRLSTHEQRERSVWSIERQRWLEELAQGDGYQTSLSKEEVGAKRESETYEGWYRNGQIIVDERDLGISGTLGRRNRLGLDHLIHLVEADRVESIYTVEVSRLWRDKSLTGDRRLRSRDGSERGVDVEDALSFGRLCKEHNVILVMPHMRLNLNDRMHWRIYRTEAERAAEELEMMQYRLGGARAMKARQGFHPGGPSIPAGYTLDTDKQSPTYQKLIPYPPHAEVVREIFSRYVALEGAAFAVVNWCRDHGVRFPLPPDELGKSAKGRWTLSRRDAGPSGWPVTFHLVDSIVTNPKYIGWWVYKGEVISHDNHPAIVDEAIFWQAVRLASSEEPRRRGRAAGFAPPLLAGLLYCCDHEGEAQRLSNSRSEGRLWYSCHRDYRNGEAEHHCMTVTDYILEKPIVEFVVGQCSYSEHAEMVLQQLQEESEKRQRKDAEHLRRRHALRQEIANLQANCEALFGSTQYTPERHAELERMIEERRRQLREINAASPNPPAGLTSADVKRVRAFLSSIKAEWSRLSFELRREFLTRVALERVLLRHDKERIWCRLLWKTGRVQEIVIHRPFVDERVPWSDDEKQILREHYLSAPCERLLELLPRRTWVAIYREGRKMGLGRPGLPGGGGEKRRWEEWEIQVLQKYYDAEISKAEVQGLLPHRGWCGIRMEASRLGLKWTKRRLWEPNLRWEEVAVGSSFDGKNVATMLGNSAPHMRCRRAPS